MNDAKGTMYPLAAINLDGCEYRGRVLDPVETDRLRMSPYGLSSWPRVTIAGATLK